MTAFYGWFSFHRGNTPGNGFTGRVLRKMISPFYLLQLPNLLGNRGQEWIRFLASLREIHALSVQPDLPENHELIVTEFRNAFLVVHLLYGFSETVKIHILGHCIPDSS